MSRKKSFAVAVMLCIWLGCGGLDRRGANDDPEPQSPDTTANNNAGSESSKDAGDAKPSQSGQSGSADLPTGGGGNTSDPDNAAGDMGGGQQGSTGEDDVRPPEAEATAAPQITSVAPTFVLSTDLYSYTPQHTLEGTAEWHVVTGPEGLSFVERGRLEWDPGALPTSAHASPHPVIIEGTVGDETVRQEFQIDVATVRQRAAKALSPTAAGQVVVTAPTSAVRGAGISLGAGALSGDTTISVNEVDRSPAFPNGRSALKVVDFGPNGLTFNSPATVALPIEISAESSAGSIGAYTFNTRESRWEALPIVEIDLDAGLVYARASHFSIYAAAESAITYELTVETMDDGSVCPGAMAARGELADGLESLDLDSVNSLPPTLQALGIATVADLVRDASFSGSLRFVRIFTLSSETGASERRKLVSTLTTAGDGARIVHSDSFANVIASEDFPDRNSDFELIDAHLAGFSTHALFPAAYSSFRHQIAGRLHIIYSEQDPSTLGTTDTALGVAAVEVAAGELGQADVAQPALDNDCDRYRGDYDTFDNSLEPRIESNPSEGSAVVAGTALKLSARVVNSNAPPTSTTWTLTKGDASAEIRPIANEDDSRLFVAETDGFYTITFAAEVDGKTISNRFSVQVTPRPLTNTAPRCAPTTLQPQIDVGQTATIGVAIGDNESPSDSLAIEWGLLSDDGSTLVPSTAIVGQGTLVGLSPTSAGVYRVGCRAFDGELWGEIGLTEVTAVDPATNQTPRDFTVSPIAAQVVVGEPVTFRAKAYDADGDSLSYHWVHAFPTGTAAGETTNTLLVNTATLPPGSYVLLVSVSDGEAPALFTQASVRVLAAPLSTIAIDADKDGFPEDIDCDDNDAEINPDASELCGNAVDEDCDGTARVLDCDHDGFLVGDAEAPDCDDLNPSINPDAFEYCDGLDNDCDGIVDNGYDVGTTCTAGLGVCAASGQRKCTADRLSAVCAATAMPSAPETCDGLDNDCDGVVDDENVCLLRHAGTWFECDAGDNTCEQLIDSGFVIGRAGEFTTMHGELAGSAFDPTSRFCVDTEGYIEFDEDAFIVTFVEHGEQKVVTGTLELVAPDLALLNYQEPDSGKQVSALQRRVEPVNLDGECVDECEFDSDQDGQKDCEDPCPDDPNPDCGATISCGQDGLDNNGDGRIDEALEPCAEPDPCSADDDKDGVYNCEDACPHDPYQSSADGPCDCGTLPVYDDNGNLTCQPSEPQNFCDLDDDQDGVPNCQDACPWNPSLASSAEPCGCDAEPVYDDQSNLVGCRPVTYACDSDQIDNDNDGEVDEAFEPCGLPCDQDGLDNNGDGQTDESGEPCAQPDPCSVDDDKDGVFNCEDACPHDPYQASAGGPCDCGMQPLYNDDGSYTCEPSYPPCDGDQFDNNGDGLIDEPGEPCGPPCDDDQLDNNGDGLIDEPGEPCAQPDPCSVDDDKDGVYNCEDACPYDNRLAADVGDCGCGRTAIYDDAGTFTCEESNPSAGFCEYDNDADGVPNCEDACPDDPNLSADPGPCGCDMHESYNDAGEPTCESNISHCEFDDDQDGVYNCEDICPDDPELAADAGPCGCNYRQTYDEQGLPTCEPRDSIDNFCERDDDMDGAANCRDVCPHDDNVTTNAAPCGCHMRGVYDGGESLVGCEPTDTSPVCDADAIDNDNDGTTDEAGEPCVDHCDLDDDHDEVPNCQDICPADPNLSDSEGDCGCGKHGLYDAQNVLIGCEENPPMQPTCDSDGIDNNGNGAVDEPNETCGDANFCARDDDGDSVDNCSDVCVDDPTYGENAAPCGCNHRAVYDATGALLRCEPQT